jgi:hypothetical protein
MQHSVLNIFVVVLLAVQVTAPALVHVHDGLHLGAARTELSSHDCGERELHKDVACAQECVMCARAKVFALPVGFFTPSTQLLQAGIPEEGEPVCGVDLHYLPLKRGPPPA